MGSCPGLHTVGGAFLPSSSMGATPLPNAVAGTLGFFSFFFPFGFIPGNASS